MILSTKSRYGLKAAYELAARQGTGPIPLRDIAENQQISEAYLEQIIAALKRAGIVSAVRGAAGGYMLAKEPGEITAGQIIRVLDGSLSPVSCVDESGANAESCANAACCATRPVWEKLRDAIDAAIDGITLQDMLNEQQTARGAAPASTTAYNGSCK